ncbi:MAG: OadG family protein [Bacteroidales bacterium]|nr:OadG family protein [Bacteroidales bacterium]
MHTLLLANMEFGIMVSIVGYTIVLGALTFLFGIYSLLPKLLDAYTRNQLVRAGKKECAEQDSLQLSGDESAAIAAAISIILSEQHDLESGKITIKKISKRYSPWSSKIYSMNEYRK